MNHEQEGRGAVNRLWTLLLVLLVMAMAGCGGDGEELTGGGVSDGETTNPEVALLELTSDTDTVGVNGVGSATLTVRALNDDNVLVEGVNINLSATIGALSSGTVITDDSGVATFTFDYGTVSDNQTAEITAQYGDITVTRAIGISVDAGTEPTAGTSVEAIGLVVTDPIIGTNGATTVTASLYDSSGRSITAVKNVTFTLSDPTLGSIDSMVTTSTGSLQTDFESRDLEGNLQIIATVDGVTKQVALTISDALTGSSDVAAEVAAIHLTADNSMIKPGESATITAQLLDAAGQIITDPKTVTFTLDDPALAFINSPGITSSGILTRALTAKTSEGTITVTATVDGYSANIDIEISSVLAPASVAVAADPATITVAGTTVVQATVLDEDGYPVKDGTSVSFSTNNASYGTIVPTARVSGGAGIAQATFTAGLEAGTAIVTAQSGSATGVANIVVESAAAGSIEFSSADPQIISTQGAGGVESSIVKFLVKDINGNPVIGSLKVKLVLSGPNGGEYLVGPVGEVTQLEVGTVDGYATVIFHSGNIPGTATITASLVDTPELTTSSGVIAIGGGTPSAEHFSLSATTLNLPGYAYDGRDTEITVRLADRYGNFNVLEGTAVSFYSECGAIDRAVNLDSEGVGTVTLRTQSPGPEPDVGLTGVCTVTAVVDGEEEFTDADASGEYESPESFVDTYDDIFIDKDDDGSHNDVYEDLVVDRNENGEFDGNNGQWDANKRIYKEMKILWTGVPSFELVDSVGNVIGIDDVIEIEQGGNVELAYSLLDVRGNTPIAGTTVDISFSGGNVAGTSSYRYPDSSTPGGSDFPITLGETGLYSAGQVLSLEASWNWDGISYSQTYQVKVIAAP